MKRLLIPFIALALQSPAEAKPIYLSCKETKLLVNTHEITSRGRTTYPKQSPDLMKEIPVFINTETNTAMRWGKAYELTTTPDSYALSKVTSKTTTGYGDTTRDLNITKMTINRSTMEFKYKSSNDSLTSGMIRMVSKSERESIGRCEIAEQKVENKI